MDLEDKTIEFANEWGSKGKTLEDYKNQIKLDSSGEFAIGILSVLGSLLTGFMMYEGSLDGTPNGKVLFALSHYVVSFGVSLGGYCCLEGLTSLLVKERNFNLSRTFLEILGVKELNILGYKVPYAPKASELEKYL